MGNYFHLFQDRQEEIDYVDENGVSDPYISYNADDDEVSWGFTEEEDENSGYSLGDYLHSDGTVNTTAGNNIVGVCVIPSNLLPDGKARFMSLVNMSSTSTSGSTSNSTYLQWCTTWNQNNLDRRYNRVPIDTNIDGTLDKWDSGYGYLPSTKSGFSVNNSLDPGTKYYNSDTRKIPSPYTSTGGLNPNYIFSAGSFGLRNALTDFSGAENTKVLNESKYITPAATACANFAPGYKNGEWYLPAMGELGFMMARFNEMTTKITAAVNAGSSGVALPLDDYFWSSSEYSQDYAWYLYTGLGYVYGSNKYSDSLVRAFLRL